MHRQWKRFESAELGIFKQIPLGCFTANVFHIRIVRLSENTNDLVELLVKGGTSEERRAAVEFGHETSCTPNVHGSSVVSPLHDELGSSIPP